MKHFTVPRFWKNYHRLPLSVQSLANKNYSLLKLDPEHPSLHFKKIPTNKQLWSVRIEISYRAQGVENDGGIYWFWIGSHAEYDRLISNNR
ncbi:MAG: hypothetical protein DMF63_10940 [Acidobacteria bacterium]|nr:MAG: hypothetical protein DMF63_10940 [Acidobacteriota bacterium]